LFSRIRQVATKKKSTKMRGIRLDEATYKAIQQAAKTRRFTSPSAFMRAAIEKELRGADSSLNESEQRISASLERNSKEIQRMTTGQQALFAYVDSLAKVILSSLPETDEDGRKSAVARGKLRYSRFLKSVGANMAGDAGEAISELVKHAQEQ
jgi:Arc/MetJ-type ribon-helix-helix transcriptional regulator